VAHGEDLALSAALRVAEPLASGQSRDHAGLHVDPAQRTVRGRSVEDDRPVRKPAGIPQALALGLADESDQPSVGGPPRYPRAHGGSGQRDALAAVAAPPPELLARVSHPRQPLPIRRRIDVPDGGPAEEGLEPPRGRVVAADLAAGLVPEREEPLAIRPRSGSQEAQGPARQPPGLGRAPERRRVGGDEEVGSARGGVPSLQDEEPSVRRPRASLAGPERHRRAARRRHLPEPALTLPTRRPHGVASKVPLTWQGRTLAVDVPARSITTVRWR
jgi:hypothetical protein